MKINLVFEDWQKNGKSIYNTQKGIELSCGDFHSGSTFSGEIKLTDDQKRELETALASGHTPVFRVYVNEINKTIVNESTNIP